MPEVRLLDSPERLPLKGLLTIPSTIAVHRGRRTSPFINGIRSLIGRLPEGVDLTVAATESAFGTIRQWPEWSHRHGIRTITVDERIDFSFWCQDEILAGRADPGGDPVLIRSSVPKREADAQVAEIVGEAMGMAVVRSEAAFEGGNIMVGDDFVLVGADTPPGFAEFGRDPGGAAVMVGPRRVHRVGTRSPVPQRQIRLTQVNGRPTVEEIWSGTGRRQPVFHLDAFLSLAGRGADGRYRILLGDPRLAVDLVADPRLTLGAHAVAEAFDEIAEWFATRPEFEVIRNPLPVIHAEERGFFSWSRQTIAREFAGVPGLDAVLAGMAVEGLAKAAVRRWYFATQNSVITLEGDGRRMVFLPTFAHGAWECLAPAERANAAIWRDLGFDVVELGDFHAFARKHGSAHCVFKVLATG